MNMHVSRALQDQFADLLDAMGFDSYGKPVKLDSTWKEIEFDGFGNGEFIVRSYWWGDCDCEDECHCRASAHNFVHIPSGFNLDWYKYPLRAANSNVELTSRMISEWRLKFE